MKKNNHSFVTRKPNKEMRAVALQFIADCSPFRFSRNLRKLLLDYISQNKDSLPVDFEIYHNDFNNLFEFLYQQSIIGLVIWMRCTFDNCHKKRYEIKSVEQ